MKSLRFVLIALTLAFSFSVLTACSSTPTTREETKNPEQVKKNKKEDN